MATSAASASAAAPAAMLDPARVAQLLDDLRSAETSVRLDAFRQLPAISRALGAERTREELVPYVSEFVDDDDDVLCALADALHDMTGLVGGPAFLHVLFEPLETLASVEEVQVRDRAVAAIATVIGLLPEPQVLRAAMPVFRHLVSSEWYTSRISACGVFAPLYARVPAPQKRELRAVFAQLCVDETPMVRRAACDKMPSVLVDVVAPAAALSDLHGAFLRLTRDEQDSVRLLSVSACVAMARVCHALGDVTRVLSTLFALCTDRSWRVRYMAADKFPDLAAAVGGGSLKGDDLVDCFVRLLTDQEAEVRTAAAARVSATARLFGAARTVRVMMSATRGLVHDHSVHTRTMLAGDIFDLTSVLSRAETFDHLLPLFLQLLRDPVPEVRLALMRRFDSLHDIVGLDVLAQALLPAICQLAVDANWRTRLAVIELLPTLARELGPEFFEARLSELSLSWLGDQVASIRTAATRNISKVSAAFGPAWALAHIVPKVAHLASRQGFGYRKTAIAAACDLIPVLGPQHALTALLPIVGVLAEDRVPNVRFRAAQTLGEMGVAFVAAAADGFDEVVRAQLVPVLSKMAEDTDADVRYFAQEALDRIAHEQANPGAAAAAAAAAEAAEAAERSANPEQQSSAAA